MATNLQPHLIIRRFFDAQCAKLLSIINEFFELENELEERGRQQFLQGTSGSLNKTLEFLHSTFQGAIYKTESTGDKTVDRDLDAVIVQFRALWHICCMIIQNAPPNCRPSDTLKNEAAEAILAYKALRLAMSQLECSVKVAVETGSLLREQPFQQP